jgi:hypothetical protein
MGYTEAARNLRQCKAIKANGERCKAWALWNSPEQICSGHTYKKRRAQDIRTRILAYKTKHPPCRCEAYKWPHRPGGGVCRWPDPPIYVSTIQPGTRAWWRPRGGKF